MSRHPFLDLLSDPPIRRLWAGLACSALGDQLYNIGIIWLAIGIAGADAGYLPAAEYAALLVTSLLAGGFADRLPARATMIATDLIRAGLTLVPVILFYAGGFNLTALVLSAVALSAMDSFFDPALLSSVPKIARTADRIQATNGLLDATSRLARLGGPFVAGLLGPFLPVIHLLSLNALSFLVSAGAIFRLGRMLDRPAIADARIAAAEPSALRRMLHGFAVAGREREIRGLLIANAIVLLAWALGLTLGIPMLIAAHPPEVLGGQGQTQGFTALGLILGAYGLGDLASNVLVAAHRPADRRRFMFSGYVILGAGLAAVPLAILQVSDPWALPAGMLAALIAGSGGPMFFIPMMTLLQTRLAGPDLTGVIRLRLVMIAAAMMLGTLLGPRLFNAIGPASVVAACGVAIGVVGLMGCFWPARSSA